MHIFRRYRHWVLGFILAFVGLPMLFFGLPNCNGPSGFGQDVEVASVGGVPIMASEFRQGLSAAARQQARGGEVPTFKELAERGAAQEVFDQMMISALISSLEARRGFSVDRDFLEEQLKEDATFLDEEGNFNGARFNAWVKANKNADWEAIYDSIQEQVSRSAFMTAQLAAGNRVLDDDVQQELLDNATKIQMEFIKVEPPVELSEEEIQAHYDENKMNYQNPPTYTAEYVAFSLKPEGPSEKVAEVLALARTEGSDFAALADEHSDLETKNGGDLDWLAEQEIELDYRKPLFALGVGEVSDPVKGPDGFYIYKVEEERTNEETAKREVHGRHIYIRVILSDAERLDLETKANSLAELANSGGDLAAASAEMGLTVSTATDFNVESQEIAGIPKVDSFQFRRAIDEAARKEKAPTPDGEAPETAAPAYEVITGRDNLYVAKKIGEAEGEIPPLSDVRDQVIDDAKAAKKGEDGYKEKTAEYADNILAQAKTLDEVKAAFPELDIQIKETRPFTKKEYLFQDQIYLQTQEIYAALEGKEEKEIAGPLTDFLGATYFIALTKKTEPTDEEKANWDEEGKAVRDRLLATARYELSEDYAADLKARKLPTMDFELDRKIYEAVLGLDQEEDADADADGGATDMPAPVAEDTTDHTGHDHGPIGTSAETPVADEAPATTEETTDGGADAP